MAWWGIALASGPHINFPMVPPDRAALASAALGQAAKHSAKASPVEQALIAAQDTTIIRQGDMLTQEPQRMQDASTSAYPDHADQVLVNRRTDRRLRRALIRFPPVQRLLTQHPGRVCA